MSYKVTAPLVIARNAQGADVYLYRDAPVPSDIDGEQLKRFVTEGFIESVGSADDEDGDGAPAKSASKDEWVAYAVAQGHDQGEAEGMTKADLVETFGK